MKTKLMQLADKFAHYSTLAGDASRLDAVTYRAALEAEIDRVCKDAERWQWLKQQHDSKIINNLWHVRDNSNQPIDAGYLDIVIDTAMQGETK